MLSNCLNYKSNKRDCYTLGVQALIIWLVFQDFVLAILYKFIPNVAFIKILFHAKDVAFLLLMTISFLFRRKTNSPLYRLLTIYFAFCFVVLSFTFLVGSDASLVNIIASVRASVLLPGMILIGMGANRQSMANFFKWYCLKFITFVALFGLLDFFLDRMFGTITFWTDTIGFGHYLEDIKNNVLINGLPGNFYGQYGNEFFSQKRLVGFWGTPLTSGYGLLMSVLFSFCSLLLNKGRKALYLFVFVIDFSALILTFTRGIIIPVLFLLPIMLFAFRPKYRAGIVALFVFAVIIGAALFGEKIISYIYDGSTIEHIRQVTDSLSQVSFFGAGYGSFGIYSNVGTESTYITLLGQTGGIGMLLFVCIYLMSLLATTKVYGNQRLFVDRPILITVILSAVVFFATGFISEQLTAYTTIAPFSIFFGTFQYENRITSVKVIYSLHEKENESEHIETLLCLKK